MCFEIIPVYIEFSIYSFCLLILAIIQISGENTAMYFRYGINRSRFIIVIDDIDMLIFPAIAAVSSPVVENIIPDINTFAKS